MALGTLLISCSLAYNIFSAAEASTCNEEADGVCRSKQVLTQDELPVADAALELFQKKATTKEVDQARLSNRASQSTEEKAKASELNKLAPLPFFYLQKGWGQWCGKDGTLKHSSLKGYTDGLCQNLCDKSPECNFVSADSERGMCWHYSTCENLEDNPEGTWTWTGAKGQFKGVKGLLAHVFYAIMPAWAVNMVLNDLYAWTFNAIVVFLILIVVCQAVGHNLFLKSATQV
mmetsp:Transcript_24399/g.42702  ORF Transcript_24399/g.42702 Transcript_24399/m.42702 type:complete len:232 (+) Transcript_24399:52-747(+)